MTLIDIVTRTAINIKNSTLECFLVLSFIEQFRLARDERFFI